MIRSQLPYSTYQQLATYTLTQTPEMIFWVREDGTFAHVSDVVSELLGYTKEELLSLKAENILVGFEKDDRLKLRSRINAREVHLLRASLKKKDGSILHVESENHSTLVGGENINVAFCRLLADSQVPSQLDNDVSNSGKVQPPSLYEVADHLHIVGTSRTLGETLDKAAGYARNSRAILIEGETGVGKESLAHLIHQLSPFREARFEKVNCGTLTNDLVISELFGHAKGAFTGANHDRHGLFKSANGGTLFLDEIGELPSAVQTMLLRVLQEGEYKRLGDNKVYKTKVRVIAATNRRLRREISAGRFRPDLYYRVSKLRLTLPPLRERKGDIQLLVNSFVTKLNRTEGLGRSLPDKASMKLLERYAFPGNIRELIGILERAYFDGNFGPLDLREDIKNLMEEWRESSGHILTFDEACRRHIIRTLGECEGSVSAAARMLDLKLSTLRGKMARLGIERDDY